MASSTRLIKRYAGARLYDTQRGCYVSLAQIRTWIDTGVGVCVLDAETGTDITRILLA